MGVGVLDHIMLVPVRVTRPRSQVRVGVVMMIVIVAMHVFMFHLVMFVLVMVPVAE